MRQLSRVDRMLDELQHGLNTCHRRPPATSRPYPAAELAADELNASELAHVAGLMRVNNAGEVSAQGLYRGQALTAREQGLSLAMQTAAAEENEHLHWCQRRLEELKQPRSLLDGLWYWGAFAIGAGAGVAGDKWSLGFVEATERQVCQHLDRHLNQLPAQDHRSRAIIETMRSDELSHAENASQAGAAALPRAVTATMALVSKLMTFSAYRI